MIVKNPWKICIKKRLDRIEKNKIAPEDREIVRRKNGRKIGKINKYQKKRKKELLEDKILI